MTKKFSFFIFFFIFFLNIKAIDKIKFKEQNEKSIQAAKYYILNGNLYKAYRQLRDLQTPDLDQVGEKNRFLFYLLFMKGDYKKALELAKDPSLKTDLHFPTVCLLQIIMMAHLEKFKEKKDFLKDELSRCKMLTLNESQTGFFWPEKTFSFIMNRENESAINNEKYFAALTGEILENVDEFLHQFKLLLFFHHHDFALKMLKHIPEEFYTHENVVEMIAYTYYLNNKDNLALNALSSLHSFNSNALKMIIYAKDKNYEEAYFYWEKTRKARRQSLVNIEYGVPLTILNNDYENGVSIASEIKESEVDLIERLSLILYSATSQENKVNKVDNLTTELTKKIEFRGVTPFPLNLNLSMLLHNMVGNGEDKIKKYSRSLCNQGEIFSCWIYQMSLEKHFSDNFFQNQEKVIFDNKSFSLVSLMNNIEENKLDENIYIYQRDIEELDERDFNLKQLSSPLKKDSLENPEK